MVNHGKIELPSARVPEEGHFSNPLKYALRGTNHAERRAFGIKYTPRAFNKGLALAGLVARKEYVDILEPFDVVKQNLSQAKSLNLLLWKDQRTLATFFDDCATNGIEHMVMILLKPRRQIFVIINNTNSKSHWREKQQHTYS